MLLALALSLFTSLAVGQAVLQCAPTVGQQPSSASTTLVIDVVLSTDTGRIPFAMASEGRARCAFSLPRSRGASMNTQR